MQTSIPNWLMQRAFLTPERIAVYDGQGKKTFMELHESAMKRARQLANTGVRKGDIVAIFMKNSVAMIECIHALHYIGAIVLLQNTRLTSHELAWQLKDSGAVYVIADDELADRIEGDIRVITMNELSALPEANIEFQQYYHFDDVATIMYTSGTTGKPKGVLQTYGNHWWSAIGSALNLGLHDQRFVDYDEKRYIWHEHVCDARFRCEKSK
jgi:o-succinylbenzoate---CoA ligase